MRSTSAGAAIASLLAFACASAPRTPAQCDAREEVIDDYLARVVTRVSNAMSPTALGRTEQVTVALEVDAKGSPVRISVLQASTPVAAEAARYAVTKAAPYGAPGFSQKACLLGGHIAFSLIASGKCDDRLAEAYVDAMSAEVWTAMKQKGLAPITTGMVILRVDVAHDGSVQSTTVQVDDTARSGAAIAALVRELSPFEAPHELIRDCVADAPLFLWYDSAHPTPLRRS